jgi:Protein kinase domain
MNQRDRDEQSSVGILMSAASVLPRNHSPDNLLGNQHG